MFKKILIASLAITSINSQAINLKEALESSYAKNPEYKIIQEEFKTKVEKFPEALAENFMPKGSFKMSQSKSSAKPTNGSRGASNTKRNSQTFSLEQPIFSFGTGAAALKAADYSAKAAIEEYYANEQDKVIKNIEAYLNYKEAFEIYAVNKQTVKFFEEALKMEQARFKLGESTKTNLSRAQASLASAKARNYNALTKLKVEATNFEKTFYAKPIKVAEVGLPLNMPTSFEQFEHLVNQNNNQLKASYQSLQAQKKNAYAVYGSVMPSVKLNSQLSKSRTDTKNNIFGGGNTKEMSTSIDVTVPILAGGGKEFSNIRKARYASRSALHNFSSIKEAVKAQSIGIWEQYLAQNMVLEAEQEAVRAAEVAKIGVKHEEAVGRKTQLDVLKAESDLLESRIKQIHAKKAYMLSAYQVMQLSGQLTAKNLDLNIPQFNAQNEYNKIKFRIIGL